MQSPYAFSRPYTVLRRGIECTLAQHQLHPSDEILCSDGWYYPATRVFAFYPVRPTAPPPSRMSVTVRPGSFTVTHEGNDSMLRTAATIGLTVAFVVVALHVGGALGARAALAIAAA